MKPPKQFIAKVERQYPAQNEVAVLRVVGHVSGTHAECWQQAKQLTEFPILEFRSLNHVPATV